MNPKCARRPPWWGGPPQIPAGVGPTDEEIVAAGQGQLNGAGSASLAFPAELLALAEDIAERRFVTCVRPGGVR